MVGDLKCQWTGGALFVSGHYSVLKPPAPQDLSSLTTGWGRRGEELGVQLVSVVPQVPLPPCVLRPGAQRDPAVRARPGEGLLLRWDPRCPCTQPAVAQLAHAPRLCPPTAMSCPGLAAYGRCPALSCLCSVFSATPPSSHKLLPRRPHPIPNTGVGTPRTDLPTKGSLMAHTPDLGSRWGPAGRLAMFLLLCSWRQHRRRTCS